MKVVYKDLPNSHVSSILEENNPSGAFLAHLGRVVRKPVNVNPGLNVN